MATEGLITIRSSFGPQETMNRFDAAVRAKGLTVFATIDHAAGATAVGLSLRPTALIIFGNAEGIAVHAGQPDQRHRSATEGAGLAGRQRGDLARPTTIRPGSRPATE